ncbi:MAG: hypothetical protein U9R79_17110 [Armatimonadota bacterium]|nr:hypothetical protein [Armatimonadota bacterium]
MEQQQTKLYTVFTDAGVQHFESETLTATTNDDLLRQVQERCPDIEFVVRDVSKPGTTLEAVVDELQARREDFDGALVVGGLNDYRPVLTGLPTIAVYNFPEFSHLPFWLFEETGGVIGATCDRGNLCKPAQREALFDDLVEKIGLLDALARMKRSHILLVTNRPFVDDDVHRGDLDTSYPGDVRQKPAGEFNEIIKQEVRDVLGTEITKIGTEEVASSEEVQNLDEEQAREIAQSWMADAEEVRGTIEREVVNSARMYLAIKGLMDKYGATASATHIRSLTVDPEPEEMIWPSLGNSQLQMEGVVGCCQGHINVVLTHMLAQYAFGRPSMMGDFMVDVGNGVGITMHCGAPWNPWGGSEKVPYVIRDHAERYVKEHCKPGAGACSEVLFPPGEPATVWRIDVPTRSILVHTGETVDGYSLYEDWTNIMCRSKLVVELEDAARVQRHLYPDVYGVHRSGTLGDFREQVRLIGRLLDFEVIEDDRHEVGSGPVYPASSE